MTHRRAVLLMVVVTLLWSIAGVVTRHLEAARSFEVTFWRSVFTALPLAIGLTAWRGPALWPALLRGGIVLWGSGLCWAVMFTAFMLALTLTTVANVLVTMAVAPLLTALLAWVFLGQRLPARTCLAIFAAGLGIAWMFGSQAAGGAWPGTLVALAVPLAGAVNLTLLQHVGRDAAVASDMLPAVMIGGLLSAVATLPLALPLQASPHDVGLLALLGVVQLAIPCLLMVRLTRELPAPEISLLALLEVVFGVAWAWLGAAEQPSARVLAGAALVLGALIANEVWGISLAGSGQARRSASANAPDRRPPGSSRRGRSPPERDDCWRSR
jgi:drug/metabolite transporter (DMT)-like permease